MPIELVPVRGSSVISHVSQPRSTRASLEVAYADLPPRRGNVEDVSTYRFLRRGAHLELFTELALSIRKVAGAIAAILDERLICDELLARAIAAPSATW